MRLHDLRPTTGPEFAVTCCGCRRRVRAGSVTHGETVYANHAGLPFTDYYCGNCAGDLRAATMARAAKVHYLMRDPSDPQAELSL